MSTPIQITTVDDPRVAVFSRLTEAQLRNRLDPSAALFVAESPKVITTALDVGLTPTALLCEQKHLEGDAAPLVARCPEMPVFTGSREVLSALTGYTLTRGVLCAFRRPQPRSVAEVCRTARRVVVLDGVTDVRNFGAIARTCECAGVDAIVIPERGSVSVNADAVKTSAGALHYLPVCREKNLTSALKFLKNTGYKVYGAAGGGAVDYTKPDYTEPTAIVLGSEDEGISTDVLRLCDQLVSIPEFGNIRSLNVSVAAGVLIYEVVRQRHSQEIG